MASVIGCALVPVIIAAVVSLGLPISAADGDDTGQVAETGECHSSSC